MNGKSRSAAFNSQRLEQELKRDHHIITAGKRLDQVARDVVRHYSTAWETGKAMLVCIDKITCVRMHKLIEFYWHERIGEPEAQLPQATDEQDEQYRRRQIEWMRQTQMAVVVSEEQGEVEKFRNWELDITPHRRLIKEGIDLPEAMRKQPQFQNMQRLSLDDAFKADEHPFRVAIEKTFEALLQIIDEMDDEESRAVREGLDEESLAVFDLLRKPDLTSTDRERIKAVAVDLLETLKAEKLRIDHWRDKESTRDAVRLTIRDYLWSEQTGLPETYSGADVRDKTEAVFVHVFRAYPILPSPYYAGMAS